MVVVNLLLILKDWLCEINVSLSMPVMAKQRTNNFGDIFLKKMIFDWFWRNNVYQNTCKRVYKYFEELCHILNT